MKVAIQKEWSAIKPALKKNLEEDEKSTTTAPCANNAWTISATGVILANINDRITDSFEFNKVKLNGKSHWEITGSKEAIKELMEYGAKGSANTIVPYTKVIAPIAGLATSGDAKSSSILNDDDAKWYHEVYEFNDAKVIERNRFAQDVPKKPLKMASLTAGQKKTMLTLKHISKLADEMDDMVDGSKSDETQIAIQTELNEICMSQSPIGPTLGTHWVVMMIYMIAKLRTQEKFNEYWPSANSKFIMSQFRHLTSSLQRSSWNECGFHRPIKFTVRLFWYRLCFIPITSLLALVMATYLLPFSSFSLLIKIE